MKNAHLLRTSVLLFATLGTGAAATRAGETPPPPARVDPVAGAAALFAAVRAGKPQNIAALLSAGVPVNARETGGATPLLVAARGGYTDAANALLERGAAPDLADADGFTPLMAGAQTGNARLLRLLLLRGANPNRATNRGLTPLMLATFNKTGKKGEPNDLACVRLLLRGGADPARRHQSGATALSIAQARGAQTIAAFLTAMSGAPTPAAIPATQADGVLTGTLSYRERVGVSAQAFAVVGFVDGSRPGAKPFAEAVVPFAGRHIPIRFILRYAPKIVAANPLSRFAVVARVVDGGVLRFRTAQPVPVLAPGYPSKNIPLVLTPTSAAEQTDLEPETIAATDAAALAGTTVAGAQTVGNGVTTYRATFLNRRLLRLVAVTHSIDYGDRTDRLYFGGADDDGMPALRAAFLSARRVARGTSAAAGNFAPPAQGGGYEVVEQSLLWNESGQPVHTKKRVASQPVTVTAQDLTAARNFARLLVADAYRVAARGH